MAYRFFEKLFMSFGPDICICLVHISRDQTHIYTPCVRLCTVKVLALNQRIVPDFLGLTWLPGVRKKIGLKVVRLLSPPYWIAVIFHVFLS